MILVKHNANVIDIKQIAKNNELFFFNTTRKLNLKPYTNYRLTHLDHTMYNFQNC